MNLPHSVAALQAENVTFELDGIDRMYQRTYARILRPLLSVVDGGYTSDMSHEAKALKRIMKELAILSHSSFG